MNSIRREIIVKVGVLLAQAVEALEACQEDEQEAYDNMPPGLQGTAGARKIQENADTLAEAVESVQAALDALGDVN